MLRKISIKNLVLIESAELELQTGLTIISGETGAGKTAFTHAIALAMGMRGDSTLIRKGSEIAVIEAVFDGMTIRRELKRDGKNRCFIDDQMVTLATLQKLGGTLIDLNSQHENKELLASETHRELLDLYGEIDLAPFTASYERQKGLKEKLLHLENLFQQKEREQEFIETQLTELNGVDFNEEESLFEEYKKLVSINELLEKSELIEQNLGASITYLAKAKALYPNSHIEEALVNAKEALREMNSSMHNLENNPKRFAYVDGRLSLLAKLKRKYGNHLDEIQNFKKSLEEKLHVFAHLEEAFETTKKELLEIDTIPLANELTIKREKASKALEKKISKSLHLLNMPDAEFTIQIKEQPLTSHGADQVEFYLKTNKGEPLLKVKECSSGGELSRLMLSLKTTLAEKNNTPTLIFDEIDANVGGETASTIGEMLHTLGSYRQVLCITHFPQVAKKGDQNIRIYKKEIDNRTVGFIEPLNQNSKEKELLRMRGETMNAER